MTLTAPAAFQATGFRDSVLQWLSDHVPGSRVAHILRVESFAAELAQCHGLDGEKAAIAGLLHDLAKYFRPQLLLERAQKAGLPIDLVDLANPHLLHADVSALVAREEFQVTDPEILAAIANHTLGQPEMSPLSCIIFLADTLEPGRGNTEILQALRQLSRTALYTAVWQTCNYTISQLLERPALIHPRIILTRNWALQLKRNQASSQEALN